MASAGAASGTITLSSGTVNAVDFVNGNNTSAAPYATGTDYLDLYNVDGTTAAQVSTAVAANATSLPITYEVLASGQLGQFISSTTPYQSFVQVSDLTTAVVPQPNSVSATTLDIAALPGTGFAANAYVMPSRHVVYYVSTTPFAVSDSALQNASMLMMSINGSAAQPLAEGVEDLQIAYGFDDNGDGQLLENGTTSDEWLYNNAGDNPASHQIANLVAVRVTIVVKSTSAANKVQKLSSPPTAEDHVPSGSSDGFVRRVLRTEIAVRNFNL
jgi:hypothetical protein